MIIGSGITIGPGVALSDTAPPPSPPVANFTGTPLSGVQPLTVNFTDTSTGSPSSWAWDFTNAGSTDSTSQNPSYVYSNAGTYSVKLTATNAAGSDNEIKTNYITVTPSENLPQPDFPNDDFANGFSGWTTADSNIVWSGGTTLAGYSTPVLPDPLPYSAQGQKNWSGSWLITPTYSTTLSSDKPSGNTGQSVIMSMTGGAVNSTGETVYGPAIYSNYFVAFNAGDSCAFDWRAVSTTDAYSIYAYMVNVDTGTAYTLLRSTAPNFDYTTNWQTQSTVVSTTGNYKFVFVAGCWDSTLGRAVGAEFRITNIRRVPA